MRAFRIAYDGAPYHGFQRQPDVETVEGELFAALGRLGIFEGEKPAGYAAAGRTDAGVSALAQTVAFDSPDWLTPAAMNSELPEHVRAWASADVSSTFHARYDAISREYVYYLRAPDLDFNRVSETLERLSGTHDFHNLTPDEGATTRTISEARAVREELFATITVRADGFLQQLVRRIISLVESIGRGKCDPAFVGRVLSEERLSGPDGIAPAPSEPLVLTDVDYDLALEIDEQAAETAREIFATKRSEREARARVAGLIESGIDG